LDVGRGAAFEDHVVGADGLLLGIGGGLGVFIGGRFGGLLVGLGVLRGFAGRFDGQCLGEASRVGEQAMVWLRGFGG
jgi:hypothetical protein